MHLPGDAASACILGLNRTILRVERGTGPGRPQVALWVRGRRSLELVVVGDEVARGKARAGRKVVGQVIVRCRGGPPVVPGDEGIATRSADPRHIAAYRDVRVDGN